MKRLPLTLIPVAGLFGCSTTAEKQKVTTELPNVIVFLADDQGYGDFSVTGNTNLHTPNIDRLASEGTMLSHFYVCPVCSPTRAEFLTGRYHVYSGIYSTQSGGELMDTDETTVADVFKRAGYVTAAFGKWHGGLQYPYHPNGRGFDEFYGFAAGHWGHYFSPLLEHNGKIVRGEGFIVDDLTNKAIDFIGKNKSNPFFLYIPYNTPHSPMQVPDEYWDRFKDKELLLRGTNPESEDIVHTRAALAMCENIDWNVGRVMKALKEAGLENKTIVLYFNDNGPNGNRWRDGMKGQKGSTDEGGVRSPLFIKWPGVIPAGQKITEVAGAIDLLPTLADFAGISAQTNYPLDGISIKPLILTGRSDHEDRIIISSWNGRISLRNNQYRFNHLNALYDMNADPGQLKDISKENPEITAYFKEKVDEWKQVLANNPIDQNRRNPVGHPDFKYTQLPAADGIPHNGIERSNRWASSSFFTKWNSLEGKITWSVEVIEEGDFVVEIYYTCPEGQQGSEVKLSFGENSLITKITEAHDPPLEGVKEDRFVRVESYIKDFIPHKAGTIHLSKGPDELCLQAVSMPGTEVMDFSLLMLTRIK
jgi:arylsulfatase A-like enzyme